MHTRMLSVVSGINLTMFLNLVVFHNHIYKAKLLLLAFDLTEG